jgi:hypothetical protein
MADALNSAITRAFEQTFKFVPIPGQTIPPSDNRPFLVPNVNGDVANYEFLRATVDPDSYKLTLSAPYSVEQGTTSATFENPFLGPVHPNNPTSVFASIPQARVQAHLFFNDKLLELFPMPTVQPASSMYASFAGPINTNSSILPGCNIVAVSSAAGAALCTWLDPGQSIPINYNDILATRRHMMYCIQTYPRSGVSVQETRATFGDVYSPSTEADGPFVMDVSSFTWTQEYGVTGTWSPITGIAITSSYIPVYEEAYGLNSLDPTTGTVEPNSGKATSNIIFDIDLMQDGAHAIQSGVLFLPNTFRWAKCRPGALQNVDLRLLLRKRDGTFVPWILDNGGTVNIKLMFCKQPY